MMRPSRLDRVKERTVAAMLIVQGSMIALAVTVARVLWREASAASATSDPATAKTISGGSHSTPRTWLFGNIAGGKRASRAGPTAKARKAGSIHYQPTN